MKLTLRMAVMACMTVFFATQAMAAARTYVVLPFQVSGPQGYGYLEKAIPSTLSSRLHWQGQIQPATSKIPTKPVSSADEAQKAQKAAGADYVVWGTASIVGNDATLDVRVRDKAGKEWHRTAQSPVGGLISAVQQLADGINQEVFGRPGGGAQGNSGKPLVNQMNPAIVVNETGQQQVYLNPQFRYQGTGSADGSRLRSRTLPFVMVDFAVGNFSGSGKNEIAVLSDHKLYIYSWDDGKLKQLAEQTVSMSNQAFALRSIDLNRDKAPELVVVTFDTNDNRPYSFIYTFAGGKLREYMQRSEYFLNVVKLPPTFTPTLIGQGWDSVKLFRPGVYIMNTNGAKPSFGTKIELPEGVNVFSFSWIPGTAKTDGDKLIVMNSQERLKVFSPKGAELHQTMERFSGSSTGMDHYKTVDGLGIDRRYQLPDKYFAPMRLLSVDLERRGEYVLLVNKPISTASQFFQRYRYYPEGEIHALYWDGVGLGLKWKTRRIKGSVVDIDLADVNNDGVLDLVVGLNTHPGTLGVGSRRCVITAYPLDLNMTNPNAAPDMSDFETPGARN